MAEGPAPGRVAVLSSSWGDAHDETAFATRAVAAAASRVVPVDVFVPGTPGPPRPDGAFDLQAVGGGGGWPAAADARWPAGGPFALAVVEDGDEGALELAGRFLPQVPTVTVASGAGGPGDARGVLAVGPGDDDPPTVGLHVPVHALAAARRHVGLGFTGYLLVLTDRGPQAARNDRPTPLVAWLAARFAGRHLVVVENAVASVWRARSLRGLVAVDTRTDLWRLVAHAAATVDLAPGGLFARECVESLLYGVPVVVPAGTTGARLAALGGGLWFGDEAELFGCVEALDDERTRRALADQGKAVAGRWYGDADGFVRRVAAALDRRVGWPIGDGGPD